MLIVDETKELIIVFRYQASIQCHDLSLGYLLVGLVITHLFGGFVIAFISHKGCLSVNFTLRGFPEFDGFSSDNIFV